MKNRIFRVILPAVLAGIALALSLIRILHSGENAYIVSLMIVPAAAGLMLAHALWERPRAGTYMMLGLSLLLLELGALSGLPLVSKNGTNLWRNLQQYLMTPYAFQQYRSIGVTFDICLIAAYGSMLILIAEAFIGKDFLSRFVSFLTAAGFIAYAVYYIINYGPRLEAFPAVCTYLPHILICLAAALLCLWKAEKPETLSRGRADGPDWETYREMLLELKRMKDEGALDEAAYAERRAKVLEKL